MGSFTADHAGVRVGSLWDAHDRVAGQDDVT